MVTYKQQLAHPNWQRKRLEIFDRDSFTCQTCLDTSTQLHVHHKYYLPVINAWEYEDDAYLTLCKHCHKTEEFLKQHDQHLVIVTKKYSPKHDCTIISSIVSNPNSTLTLIIFSISSSNKLKFLKEYKDPSQYSMKDLLDNAKKLL